MDLIKIGKYISYKRKELGFTQKQLAELLGMSDKSVSKWERGICLPDVSVYIELCNILEISINEFLAGEDISEENIIRKSEDNLIQVTKDSKEKQNSLKRSMAVLLIITIVTAACLGVILFQKLNQPKNYIVAVDQESTEMKTAKLLSGVDGAFLFKYFTKEDYQSLTIYMSEYRSGELMYQKEVADCTYEDIDSTSEGMIAIVPNFDKKMIKLIFTDDYAKFSTEIPIMEDVTDLAGYGRTITYIEEQTPINYNMEQGILVISCGKNAVYPMNVQQIESGEHPIDNEYVYYFSFKFDK